MESERELGLGVREANLRKVGWSKVQEQIERKENDQLLSSQGIMHKLGSTSMVFILL